MTQRIGSIAGLQSDRSPIPPIPTPETADGDRFDRLERLERRLTQIEVLLSDIMQQLDRPYRDQNFDGKTPKPRPHVNGKPPQAKPVFHSKPQPPKSKAKPKPKKAKKGPTPPTQALIQEKTQADNVAIIAFLSQEPDKLWSDENLRIAIEELCSLNKKKVESAIRRLSKTGHLSLQKDVEVDGSILKGSFQFAQNPGPTEEQIAIQEKQAAVQLEQRAASAKLTADACDKLLSVLDNGDRITTKELIDMGISFSQQKRLRESDAYKASGIQCEKLPDETYEYSIETTD